MNWRTNKKNTLNFDKRLRVLLLPTRDTHTSTRSWAAITKRLFLMRRKQYLYYHNLILYVYHSMLNCPKSLIIQLHILILWSVYVKLMLTSVRKSEYLKQKQIFKTETNMGIIKVLNSRLETNLIRLLRWRTVGMMSFLRYSCLIGDCGNCTWKKYWPRQRVIVKD